MSNSARLLTRRASGCICIPYQSNPNSLVTTALARYVLMCRSKHAEDFVLFIIFLPDIASQPSGGCVCTCTPKGMRTIFLKYFNPRLLSIFGGYVICFSLLACRHVACQPAALQVARDGHESLVPSVVIQCYRYVGIRKYSYIRAATPE